MQKPFKSFYRFIINAFFIILIISFFSPNWNHYWHLYCTVKTSLKKTLSPFCKFPPSQPAPHTTSSGLGNKLVHCPPLNDGEQLVSGIMEFGPPAEKFIGYVAVEIFPLRYFCRMKNIETDKHYFISSGHSIVSVCDMCWFVFLTCLSFHSVLW